MTIFGLLWMTFWGLIVGGLAKMIHPGKEDLNAIGTILIGVGGSYLGGFLAFFLGWSNSLISTSGWLMSILCAVGLCYVWMNRLMVREWIRDKTGV